MDIRLDILEDTYQSELLLETFSQRTITEIDFKELNLEIQSLDKPTFVEEPLSLLNQKVSAMSLMNKDLND